MHPVERQLNQVGLLSTYKINLNFCEFFIGSCVHLTRNEKTSMLNLLSIDMYLWAEGTCCPICTHLMPFKLIIFTGNFNTWNFWLFPISIDKQYVYLFGCCSSSSSFHTFLKALPSRWHILDKFKCNSCLWSRVFEIGHGTSLNHQPEISIWISCAALNDTLLLFFAETHIESSTSNSSRL